MRLRRQLCASQQGSRESQPQVCDHLAHVLRFHQRIEDGSFRVLGGLLANRGWRNRVHQFLRTPQIPSRFVLFAAADFQGFMAAASMKAAGKVRDIDARAMVT
jgi:hypothetical protein